MEKSGKNKIWMTGAAAVILAAASFLFLKANKLPEPVYCPVKGFSNMCAYDGKVYAGVNAPYGEAIVQESSIFTIWEDKVYYVEKVQEAYDSLTDELLEIKRADKNGNNQETLADDVFLAGAGHEKLVGNKLFYGYGYDDNSRMRYAYVDINTKERGKIDSGRMDDVLGYDGNYIYYKGRDGEKGNLLGRIRMRDGRDEAVSYYAEVDEEGYIDSVFFSDGKFYCFTLTHKPEGHDYRMYTYRLQVRDGGSGKMEKEIPVDFTGSSNYSLLLDQGEIYTALGGDIVAISLDGGSQRKLGSLKDGEYWGIMHFIPGDGYLYYEAIAETDEETGNNDYFYRVPLKGGESELLKEWFTVSERKCHLSSAC